MGSKCIKCGCNFLPPRPICSECSGKELEWVEMRGEGILRSFTVVHVPLSDMKESCPYIVGIIKLDEGPSISGLILDKKKGDEIILGSRLKAEFLKKGDETSLCFRFV